ncbi:Gfo/Idh/MocA family oxidoreductase [Lactobacillus kefiranofaciens]|nr:Gfo/Idh/MocA family oxidoreductase [Lactobacillus kefiranofaciens]MCP9331457.1 Gfo/Idh/MocA family oxidoreductase [Lactobacillus kefiranofaciens]QNT45076.1 Gfo/Idh/MocA family oxidoreductase [Lactobacillus kefiranofaciens]
MDIVYIGTPNNTHYDFIKKALLAGKHVLCEKPMVINREQFLELVNLAKEKQLILEEAYTPFHMPVMNKIKEAIDAGKIGKVCEVQANFSAAIKNPNPKGRLYNPALGGGNLLDMGCYPICFAQLFMSVTNLKIKSDVQMGSTGVDIASQILLENDKQQFARLSSSFRDLMPKIGVIAGEKGYIIVDHFSRSDHATIHYLNSKTEEINAGDSEQAWLYEAYDFEQYIDAGKDRGELAMSYTIIKIMDVLRQSWKFKYPNELKIQENN